MDTQIERLVICTEDDVDDYFNGILIECSDIVGTYRVPGWECKQCGWRIGTRGLPPAHRCTYKTEK